MRNVRLPLLVLGAAAACAVAAVKDPAALYRPQVDVEADPPGYYSTKLFRERNAPKPGDFLAIQGKQKQTFEEYTASQPPRATRSRHTIYLCIVGPTDAELEGVVKQSASFLETYYALPVKILPPVPLEGVTSRRFEEHNAFFYDGPDLVDRLLKPIVPEDALTLIGCTREQLYGDRLTPSPVLQSCPLRGVGVVSLMWVLDSPAQSPPDRRGALVALRRCFHNVAAAVAWTLGSPYCHKYYCGMNLAYSLEELDSLPLEMCPECLKKMRWNLGIDPVAHCDAVGRLCARAGLNQDAAWYAQRLAQLRQAEREAKAAKRTPPAKPAPQAPRPAAPAAADPAP